jgi:hypothetical protein
MSNSNHDYNLFLWFIETFSPTGFKNIDSSHSLIQKLDRTMQINNQFFFIADLIKLEIVYTSKRSSEMIGIKPEEVTPYHFFEATNPDQIERHSLGRLKLLKIAQDIYTEKKGIGLISSNFEFRNPQGSYSNLLVQCYLFYVADPHNTVFEIQIQTNIDWYKKFQRGNHYYVGNDMSFFRFPDEALLNIGNMFSKREFEIIRLIESGLNSEQIGEKLFISKHTVNTHRSKILRKTEKTQISDLIYSLKESGQL